MTIIVAYTPSASADAALDFGINEALAHRTKLVLVNSSRGASPVDSKLASDEALEGIRQRLSRSGIEHHISQPVRGNDVVEEVINAAREHAAKMIVIGTRHRSAVGKFILGSTAQQIILESPVPVVAVKPSTHKRPEPSTDGGKK